MLEEYRPVLETMGERSYLGPSGSGTRMKLVVDVVAANLAMLAESLALGETYALTLGRKVQTPLPVTGLVSQIYTAGACASTAKRT